MSATGTCATAQQDDDLGVATKGEPGIRCDPVGSPKAWRGREDSIAQPSRQWTVLRESRKASREWVDHQRDPARCPTPDRLRWVDYRMHDLPLPQPMAPYLVTISFDANGPSWHQRGRMPPEADTLAATTKRSIDMPLECDQDGGAAARSDRSARQHANQRACLRTLVRSNGGTTRLPARPQRSRRSLPNVRQRVLRPGDKAPGRLSRLVRRTSPCIR